MKKRYNILALAGLLAFFSPTHVSTQKTNAQKEPTVQEVSHFASDTAKVMDFNATLRSNQKDLSESLSDALKSDDKDQQLGALRLIEYAGNEEFDRQVARLLKSEDETLAEAALDALISSSSDKAVKELTKEWRGRAKEDTASLALLAEKIEEGPITEKMLKSLLGIANNRNTPEEEASHALNTSKHMLGRINDSITFDDAVTGIKELRKLEDLFELRGEEIERDATSAPLCMAAPRSKSGLILINNNYLLPKGKGIATDLNDIVLDKKTNGIYWRFKLLLQGGKKAYTKIEIIFPVPNYPATIVTLELTATECISTLYGTRYTKDIDALDKWIEFEFAFLPSSSVKGSNYREAVDQKAVSDDQRYGRAFVTTDLLPSELRISCYRGSAMLSPGEIKEISELPK